MSEINDPDTVKQRIDLYYESGNPKCLKMAGYMLLKSLDPAFIPYVMNSAE